MLNRDFYLWCNRTKSGQGRLVLRSQHAQRALALEFLRISDRLVVDAAVFTTNHQETDVHAFSGVGAPAGPSNKSGDTPSRMPPESAIIAVRLRN